MTVPRIVALAVAALLAACEQADQTARPDIVVIMADDMGYSDVGAFGGEIATPTLDRLAMAGLRFTRFYNTGKCSPTRAALLTGRYAHRVGLGSAIARRDRPVRPAGPYQGYLEPDATTIAEALKAVGYSTYMTGKWHVGERPEHWPLTHGFDRYFGLISGASSYFGLRTDDPRGRQFVLDDAPWTPPADGFYMTDAFTDRAVDYVREHVRDRAEEPFFLYLAYTAPHWPLHAPEPDIARYAGRYDAGWDAVRAQRFQRMAALGVIDHGAALPPRPASVPAWREVRDQADWARRMEVHAAMVDRMDQGIGRLVATLERAGRLDNTLILFFSDNGASAETISGRNLNDPAVPMGLRGSYVAYREPWAHASNTPLRDYKLSPYEGGIASPMIAHWPARVTAPGRIVDVWGHVIDVLPTALAAAGADIGQDVDGRNLIPLLDGTRTDHHEALFWEYDGGRAHRKGDWKIVYDKQAARWALYDLATDPAEQVDRSADRPDLLGAMIDDWGAWAVDVGAKSADFSAMR